MRSIYCILILGLLASGVRGNADSLWSAWSDPSQPDSARATALFEYNWNYVLFSDLDSGMGLAQRQYDFAVQKGVTFAEARALDAIGVGHYLAGDLEEAERYLNLANAIHLENGYHRFLAGNCNNLGLVRKAKGLA